MANVRAQPVRFRPPRRRALEQAGFLGIWDSKDPPDSRADRCRMLINVYPTGTSGAPRCAGWPGFQQSGDRLGSAGVRRGQGRHQYGRRDGTEATVDIVGGLLYEWDWATRTHTPILAGTLAFDPAARVFSVNFQDELILTDGVSKPVALRKVAGVWSRTVLANAPVAYGQPVVKANKLFFINAANPIEIQWSEEADPTLGYAAVPYNNAWQLGQTATDRFYAMAATENALYLARERSITAISGDVTPEFASSSTQESVSSSIGTRTPIMLVAEGFVWLLDASGRPQRFRVGGTLDDSDAIWRAARETVGHLARASAQLEACALTYWPELGMVLYGVPSTGALLPDMVLGFGTGSGEFMTVRRNRWTFTELQVVRGLLRRPTLTHTDAEGYVYDHGFPDGELWNDLLDGVPAPITHTVEGAALGYSTHADKAYDELHVAVHARTALTGLAFDYQVPAGWRSPGALESLAGGTTVYGAAIYNVSTYTGGSNEERLVIGVSDEGRWFRPRFRHAALDEQFGLEGWSLFMTPIGPIPETK